MTGRKGKVCSRENRARGKQRRKKRNGEQVKIQKSKKKKKGDRIRQKKKLPDHAFKGNKQ